MAIICCSKDGVLSEKMISLYGEAGVISIPHVRFLHEKDMQEGELLIVDVKHNKVVTTLTRRIAFFILWFIDALNAGKDLQK